MNSLCVNNPPKPNEKSVVVVTTTQDGNNNNNNDNNNSSETNNALHNTQLDFIGSSHAVKGLFLLPYSNNQSISVAVHNLGGTLIIDSDPGHHVEPTTTVVFDSNNNNNTKGNLKRDSLLSSNSLTDDESRKNDNAISKTFVDKDTTSNSSDEYSKSISEVSTSEALTIVNAIMQIPEHEVTSIQTIPSKEPIPVSEPVDDDDKDTTLINPIPDNYVRNYIPLPPDPREYLPWQFRDMNLLVGSDTLVYRPHPNDSKSTALAIRVEDSNVMKNLLAQHQQKIQNGTFVADRDIQQQQQPKRISYADATRKSILHQHQKETPLLGDENVSTLQSAGSDSKDDLFGEVKSFTSPDYDSRLTLQTCIVPSPTESVEKFISAANETSAQPQGTPVSTVIDTYLDNIMANVPQLALCLREKGFIQSVKLLSTEAIPSRLLHASTIDTTKPFDMITDRSPDEEIFSPEIMEMNASTLLRFLKANCTKDNSTYLMRREAGQTNIQLYDISAISSQRQRKWIWWLAMISYRFANRLRHVSLTTTNKSLQRCFRDRQRSLLQNTLDLLETLADMNGNAHESLVAAVMENLADTFLCSPDDDENTSTTTNTYFGINDSESLTPVASPAPVTSVSPQQPYAKSTVDALYKAQDHLSNGIKVLWPVLDKRNQKLNKSNNNKESPKTSKVHVSSVRKGPPGSDSDSDDDDDHNNNDATDGPASFSSNEQMDPLLTQLFGLHQKLINVSLRLAGIHLRNYYSSSAMQALRICARRIADALYLYQLQSQSNHKREIQIWLQNIQLQYTWLWEHCGHFARSYAADNLWRERGHASGDDVISVLQDVEAAFTERRDSEKDFPELYLRFSATSTFLTDKPKGMISLNDLSGVVFFPSVQSDEDIASNEHLLAAKAVLSNQKTLQRDQRTVLVAACISYSVAIESLNNFANIIAMQNDGVINFDESMVQLLYQRLGDACNEVGKIFLNELRTVLTDQSKDSTKLAAEPLLSSAEFWFLEGIKAFEKSRDLRNLALMRCNVCQCYKLRANNVFADSLAPFHKKHTGGGGETPKHAEICLQEAANQLQAAHESLGERDFDPVTWDMVSGELAATFLVLGVRRRQSMIGSGNLPLLSQDLRLASGKERSIVEPIERALQIYETMSNHHQAAAAHYQLALFYAKIWTCQRDEVKTREKLGAGFRHYGAAFNYFSRAIGGNEVTFCLLCLDLASLYSAVSGEECLGKALQCCLDTHRAFSEESIRTASLNLQTRDEWLDKMQTLATNVEDRVFKLLRSLIKLESEQTKATAQPVDTYKNLYRIGLEAKMKAGTQIQPISVGDAGLNDIARKILQLHYVLTKIRENTPKSG